MGVRGLNKYITTNIRPSYKFWKLDRKLFKCLDCKDSQIFKFPINASKNDSVNLVIDGYSFYYFIADKFNWFPYESLNLIELSQKYLNFLLSIENLEKIIFVFDGANINIKNQTEKERRELKIISIKDFYNEIVSKEFQEKNFPKSITPSPLSFMTFMQFLLGAQKIYHCIELKFALLEADKYIAELANKYNGYVLSNDSDFFIYKTPGYINFNSLEFPKEINENINDEYNFIIKYQLYTNKEIFLNLKLTYDMLPIFASLCGNDYFKIDNYPRLKQHFKNYRNVRKNTNSIQYPIYKHIVNFILDNATQTKRPRNQTFTSRYTDLTDTQKLIIENIFTNWSSTDDFKLTLINSVRQYYLSSTNEYNTDIFEDINGNSKVLSLDKNILSSYNSGCLYPEIMNVLINNQFECNQYFEDVNRSNCWDITQNIRKRMYELLKIRNNEKDKPVKIEEILRNNTTLISKNVNIYPYENSNLFNGSIEIIFDEYLRILNSNESCVKKLPYYLIPIVSNLRFLLKEKLKTNNFIYKSNDKAYSNIVNNINHENCDSDKIAKLYHYELEALIASSIIAMTFSFLNIKASNRKINHNISSSISSISENIRQNKNIDGYDNNLYKQFKENRGRSLKLKSNFSIKNFKNKKTLFENAIQIYAEFQSILIMNSYLLQSMSIMDNLPEFQEFFSMYQYQCEEAYYNMIDFFRINRDNKISFIFNHLYTIIGTEKQKEAYLEYLEEIYYIMFNSIIAN